MMKKTDIKQVIDFATKAHKGQKRSSGVPYINHPLSVAKRLADYGFDDYVHQAVAILHDVIEDCDVSQEEITELFGSDIGICVQQLTNIVPPGTKFSVKHAQLLEHAKKMHPIAIRVKICDRIDNLNDMKDCWEYWKQMRYASAALDLIESFEVTPDDTKTMLQDLRDIAQDILNRK